MRGSSESDDDSDVDDSAASDSDRGLEGETLGGGDADRRFSDAFGSRGLVCKNCRLWIAVLVDEVRLNGGAKRSADGRITG